MPTSVPASSLVQDTITYTTIGALAVNLGMTAAPPEPKNP